MDPFITGLRARLEKAVGETPPWGDINPLVIIGLTESILDLGLNEDQIYAVVRSYGRQLAGQVHPDRHPANISPERQKQILGAFDVLDDRQNFSKALAQFRNLRAEDRKEAQILRQTLSALRLRLSGLEQEFAKLTAAKEELANERRVFEQLKAQEPLELPKLKAENKSLINRIDLLENTVRQTKTYVRDWKDKFGFAAEFISALGSTEPAPFPFATEARWVVIAALWHPESPPPMPLNKGGKIDPKFRQAALLAGIQTNKLTGIIAQWQSAVKLFGTPGKLEPRIYPLGISILKLTAGIPKLIYGDTSTCYTGRIIGSIPPDKLPIDRSRLVNTTSQEMVFETLSPLLVPGGLLTSVHQESTRRVASWSMTVPAFRFSTKRYILTVG